MSQGVVKPSFSRTVRRRLIARLSMVALAMSVLLGAVAAYREKGRAEAAIVDLVVQQAVFFDVAARAGAGDDGTASDLVREFGSFLSVEPEHGMGRIVFARLFDADGRPLVEHPAAQPKLSNRLDAVDHRDAEGVRVWHRWVRVDGRPHVLLGGPMHGPDGQVVARAEGVVRVSDAALASIRESAFRAAFWVALIAIIMAAAVYPIVMTLTRRLIVLSGNLLQANIETAQVLGSAIAKRDSDTSEHNFRVTIISVKIAEAHGMDDDSIRNLIKGAFVHDVGKIAISDQILLKPGRLTDEEFEVMKTHVAEGVEIVERSSWLNDAVSVVRDHHEKFDGTGYMQGLKGEDIPTPARIFAIADVFDALTSRRPYKEPLSFEQTMKVLEDGRGTHFDPALLDTFVPIAPEVHRDLIEHPREKPGVVLEEIVRHYFSQLTGELRV